MSTLTIQLPESLLKRIEALAAREGYSVSQFVASAASEKLGVMLTMDCLRHHCTFGDDGKQLLKTAMDELGLSARAHDRILRVGRTITDLEGSESIQAAHVIEAISYRSLDRKLWMR